jgi:hypothetical protein
VNPRLTRPIISIISILLLALIFPVFAQNGGSSVPFSQAPYRIGERLTYNISYSNFASAAHVQVQVMGRGTYFGRDAFKIHAHVETAGVVNVALFAINKDYTTYVVPESGLPFRTEEVTRDAVRSVDSVQDFAQPAGTDAIPPKQKVFPGTYDFISAFYRCRALPLEVGATYNLTVRGESTDYQLEVKVVGKETVKTNVGSYSSIVTQIRIDKSPVKNLKVYFTDDERHVPVMATGRVASGDLNVELAASEMVKPPPGAKEAPTPVVTPAPTPGPTPTPTPPTEWPFGLGEELNYQLFLTGTNSPVGTATFKVAGRSKYNDRDGLLLTVNAQTTGTIAKLFVANDKMESYVNPKDLLPFKTVFNLVEGSRRFNQTLTINQEAGTATPDRGQRIDIPVGSHDYLSFFYAVRTFNIFPGKRNAISILVEGKPKTLFVSSLKREVIQLGQQKIPAIALSITTDDQQSDKYQFRLWLSDDNRRLPLRITCATQLGALRADLAIVPTARL